MLLTTFMSCSVACNYVFKGNLESDHDVECASSKKIIIAFFIMFHLKCLFSNDPSVGLIVYFLVVKIITW